MAFGSLSIKGRALRYLSQREHSRHELERKLLRHVRNAARRRQQADDAAENEADNETSRASSDEQQIAPALDALAAAGLLSDERAAASVLHSQGARYGVRRLKQTLQQRGHEPELIDATLQQARSTELARAHDVWRRRFGAAPADAAERARQVRFLMGRGFESDVIRRVIRGIDDPTFDEV
ncbi:MAG: recombination regulator RecX [Rubrivivax sp.]|nr:recombination regulator RecX [Rubrivivax sp.]